VVVRYYLGHEWQAPLVFVLLVTFALGVALGILASMGRVFRQRRALAGTGTTRQRAAVDGGFEEGA